MDHRRRSRTAYIFSIVWLLASVMSGCGPDLEKVPPATGTVITANTPTTGMDACVNCHTAQTNDWLTSRHANVESGNLNNAGYPSLATFASYTTYVPACWTCHDPLGDSANLVAGYTGTARPVIGCESCHGPGSLHADAGGGGPISRLSNTDGTVISSATLTLSGQFVMCTNCHKLLDENGQVYSTSGHYKSVTDTHFATAGTYTSNYSSNTGTDLIGYSMDFGRSTVCTDCHNPHKTADINKEWAASAHADRDPDGPWAHYNWSCDYDANCGLYGAANGDRATCQRCHTTTGFAGYADALADEDTALADAIWTGQSPRIAFQTDFKPEMLKCTGCHTDNRGTVRNPGAYEATYKIPVGGFPSTSPVTADVSYKYPDISGSNVCIPCHTARGSGRAIHEISSAQTFSSLSFPDGHYLSAGGTMFKGTAYEYAGRSYDDPASFKHKLIGTSAVPNTGTNGPCIGCHMERPGLSGNHRFQPMGTDANGAFVSVSSEICFNCHAGSGSSLAEMTNAEREDYEYALEALEYQLLVSDPSYSFTGGYPYFTNTYHLYSGDSDYTGNTTGKNNVGAAFNFSLLHHEPGAYIHNSRYVKRIIYDSIDWMDNRKMDYSVGDTLSGFTGSFKDGAMKYLLSQVYYDTDGSIIPSPAERP